MTASFETASTDSRALVVWQNTAPTSLEPKFMLQRGSMVMIAGVEHQVERRLPDGRWQFLSIEGAPLFQTDAQIAHLLKKGEFHAENERGLKIFAPPPLSPIAIGAKAHAENLRKHDFVQACLDSPYGDGRSRRRLMPAIKACAERRNEDLPAFTSVCNWLDEFQLHGEAYGTAAFSDRHDLKGRWGGRLLDHQQRAIDHGIERWLELGKKAMAYELVCEHVRQFDAKEGHLLDKASLRPDQVDQHGALKPPSLRTFERHCGRVDRMVRDWALVGPTYAKQKNRTYQTTAIPDRPYAEVEVDHCTFDILVVDDESNMPLGRPDAIFFRDRATAMIIGYGLGFEQPSYASFVQGLKHAMYPKSMECYPSIRNPWPCFGRIENLYVDNALHFIGDNIRAAGRELGFNLVRFEPRSPWLKGGLERVFGAVNTGFLHSVHGSTLQNVVVRRDHEHLGEATLTLKELEFLLNLWICDSYHADPRKALGPIRGVGARPLAVWQEKAKNYYTPRLPHPDLFMSLAGDVEYRTIQKNGITWDYITYESPDLWALLSHPKHKRSGEGGATKYKVVRDPFNLGEIALVNPHDGVVLRIPATLGHRGYASGLTLHQHRVIMSNAKDERDDETVDVAALEQSKAALAKIVAAIRRHPGRRKIERAVARYLDNEKSRRGHSEIISALPPGAAAALPDYSAQQPIAMAAYEDTPAEPLSAEPTAWADKDDDLEDLIQDRKMEAYHD